jgi:hypothetical protein
MKQPTIHQNLLGKKELADFNQVIDDIASGKIKHDAAKADEFKRINKIGEYREWEFDHKRIEEIQAQVSIGEAHMHPGHKIRYPRNSNNKPGKSGPRTTEYDSKLKRIAEEKKLISEIENL